MRVAFYRGFLAGSGDERAEGVNLALRDNPYAAGPTARRWTRGFEAGARWFAGEDGVPVVHSRAK